MARRSCHVQELPLPDVIRKLGSFIPAWGLHNNILNPTTKLGFNYISDCSCLTMVRGPNIIPQRTPNIQKFAGLIGFLVWRNPKLEWHKLYQPQTRTLNPGHQAVGLQIGAREASFDAACLLGLAGLGRKPGNLGFLSLGLQTLSWFGFG